MSDISSTKSPTKAFVGANAKDANAGQNSFAMRVQKKVLSKLSKRGVVRILANDRVNSLMDTLYALLKFHYDSQTAEKVVKNIIKLIFKLGAMDREHTLNEVQSQLLVTIERELRQLALTLQSFQAISYSFNLAFLLKLFDNLRYAILSLAEQTLSDKSSRRVIVVFDQLSNKDFLKQLGLSFPANENSPRSSPQFALLVQKFTDDLAALMCAAEGSNDNMALRSGNVR